MVRYTFKLRNTDGSIPEDVIGSISREPGIAPRVGNVLKLKGSLVKITQQIADGLNFILVVDKFNSNAPYIDPSTLKKNRKFRR
jgi:hypothetical protein